VALARGTRPEAARARLLSFRDYLDIALFHPVAGYYSTGRVDLRYDFRTFPVALAPSFGQMVAEQIVRMWDGMRRAGTLGADETFTVAELGAGDGTLAESILDHVHERATGDARWRDFERQLAYVSYDRSPALSETQRKRNAHFAPRFEARQADATELTATIPRQSLKGVILSNELLDCFSVHKVVWDAAGVAEIAFVVPSLARTEWSRLAGSVPSEARELVGRGDDAIRRQLVASAGVDRVYFDQASFPAFLEAIHRLPDYEGNVSRLRVEEAYLPVSVVPEVADHLHRYAGQYEHPRARAAVAYVNLGAGKFDREAGAALRAGYVLTVDYGFGWAGTLAENVAHLRTYGLGAAQTGDVDPYDAPTLHDITTDVNFGHVAAEGRLVGLEVSYFGPQRSLRMGTSVRLDETPAARSRTREDREDFRSWAALFERWDVYRVLVQQKRGTDPAYVYPAAPSEPLGFDDGT
jgi:SAM-dependent MidA family methyltransferase